VLKGEMKKLLNITYMIELQHYEIDVTYELDMKEDLNKNVLVIYSTIKDKDMVHMVADFIYRIFHNQRPSLGLVYFDAKHLYNRPLCPIRQSFPFSLPVSALMDRR